MTQLQSKDGGIITKYNELFAPESRVNPKYITTLGEGNTSLVRLERLESHFGIKARVYAKCEGQNPTGSFKDRGMAVAVSKAYEEGRKGTICASTGNTSASAAAYSARARLTSYVIVPSGKISPNKLVQAVSYGATIVQVGGNFDDAMQIAYQLEKTGKAVLVNSLNPHRSQGQKTVAFEIVEQLGRCPDINFYPVGNGLNGAAHWAGYKQMVAIYGYNKLPRMIGVQAEGAAAMVEGRDIKNPETIASAIRIGRPVNREKAQNAINESNGLFVAVTDEEILKARKYLATKEGIDCELASAASLAGMVRLHSEGKIDLHRDLVVVLTITGSGLKDTTGIEAEVEQASQKIVPATLDAVLGVLGW